MAFLSSSEHRGWEARACVKVQWWGELGLLKFDMAGVQFTDILQGSLAEQCHMSSNGVGGVGTNEPGAAPKDPGSQAEEFRPYIINCNNLGFLDFLTYKMGVQSMAIKGPCIDGWSHLSPADIHALWPLLSRPRECCFFDGANDSICS